MTHNDIVEEILESLERHDSNRFRGMRGSEIMTILRKALTQIRTRGYEEGIADDWNKVPKSKIRQKAEEATSEMVRSLREEKLDQLEKAELFGYIRVIRTPNYIIHPLSPRM